MTRYNLHKCSAYCKRKRKRGKIFVTECKFGFPRPACDTAKLHCVEERLKQRRKIYEIPCSESEVRVNDYNPLLLMLWKANIDIQFVAENSLALAQYVTGYVTKAERSQMTDVWDEISETKEVCSRLWSFGLRLLRSREQGEYETADLLLSDHLVGKSVAVQWVNVLMPHLRKRRLKNHDDLVNLETTDPDSEDIFLPNLITHHYPKRPPELEHVCLYDFVANYDYYNGYRKRIQPRLVSHTIFDPQIDTKREAYYYSLIVLFLPYHDESSLIRENETNEQAYHRLLFNNHICTEYGTRLQDMLKAEANLKRINEARNANAPEVQKEKNEDDDDDKGLEVRGEAKSAMQDILDCNDSYVDKLTLEGRIAMLNADQRRVFDKVKAHLRHQLEHEQSACQCNDIKPLQMFISGVGGTGKSFLI